MSVKPLFANYRPKPAMTERESRREPGGVPSYVPGICRAYYVRSSDRAYRFPDRALTMDGLQGAYPPELSPK